MTAYKTVRITHKRVSQGSGDLAAREDEVIDGGALVPLVHLRAPHLAHGLHPVHHPPEHHLASTTLSGLVWFGTAAWGLSARL